MLRNFILKNNPESLLVSVLSAAAITTIANLLCSSISKIIFYEQVVFCWKEKIFAWCSWLGSEPITPALHETINNSWPTTHWVCAQSQERLSFSHCFSRSFTDQVSTYDDSCTAPMLSNIHRHTNDNDGDCQGEARISARYAAAMNHFPWWRLHKEQKTTTPE